MKFENMNFYEFLDRFIKTIDLHTSSYSIISTLKTPTLSTSQRNILSELQELKPFNIIYKNRCEGITFILELYCYWLAITKRDSKIFFFQKRKDLSFLTYALPSSFVTKNHKNEIEFVNGSSVYFMRNNDISKFRGITINSGIIVFDEIFPSDIEDILEFSYSFRNRPNIIVSTHFDYSSEFEKIFKQTEIEHKIIDGRFKDKVILKRMVLIEKKSKEELHKNLKSARNNSGLGGSLFY